MDNVTLTDLRVKIMIVTDDRNYMLRMTKSVPFIFFKLQSEAKHPVGGTIVYFCSQFPKTIPSLPEILPQLLFFLPIAPLSGCSATLLKYPFGKHSGLWHFKDSQKRLGPELGQPQG